MNKHIYELTGVTDDEIREYCKTHKYKYNKISVKKDFFKKIQDGKIVRDKNGKLIDKE